MTPAMAAGVSKTVAPKPGKRGPYKKRVA